MTIAQLYQLIDDNIRENHNEEITGAIDNSVRHAVVDWVWGEVGDLNNLNTNNKTDLVSAINEALTEISNNQGSVNDKLFGKLTVKNVTDVNTVTGLTDDYYMLRENANKLYFAVKKSLDYEFENAKLLFPLSSQKVILTTPNVANSNYNIWALGVINNVPADGELMAFDVWFQNKYVAIPDWSGDMTTGLNW